MGEFAIGQGVSRFEDPRLVRGGGSYTDDVQIPGMAYGVVLRSPHGHAKIKSIDAAAAMGRMDLGRGRGRGRRRSRGARGLRERRREGPAEGGRVLSARKFGAKAALFSSLARPLRAAAGACAHCILEEEGRCGRR